MGTFRNPIEVLLDGCEWRQVNATLDETSLVLAPLSDGFISEDFKQPSAATWSNEKRFVKIVKQEGHGLGISIQGGADSGKPIIISKA